ncbi:peptidase [Devosia epidermidihirudinis]|uniref:Peptidase n=1 Tax=Devosia epidermidihirudinis TaxID=1293439 RepID=A0A0F5QBA7_9HYPH|nr:ImmA/IrrE family metallo-endopeptidase [Devosia epidermidihirudinis]KKC38006.1 peptidase [Devosia epidermidihirudinis]
MRNIILSRPTALDIDSQVQKVLRGLGNPEPPLHLSDVRELLKLDRRYYSSTDDSFLREMVSRIAVAGKQVLLRPSLLRDAIKSFDLRALYIPDRRRILLDREQPDAKQRWNEAHEVGHSLIPWHDDLMLGDQDQTLSKGCHDQIEAEANYAAGQLLFLQDRFPILAKDAPISLSGVRSLKGVFGNTLTTTFWRFIESSHLETPMLGLIGGHPKRNDLNPAGSQLLRHMIESPAFKQMFATPTLELLTGELGRYCGPQRAGPLGHSEVILLDRNGDAHRFGFESFFNGYDCLTLAVYRSPQARIISLGSIDLPARA